MSPPGQDQETGEDSCESESESARAAAATAAWCRGSVRQWATKCARVEPVELAVRRLHAAVAPFETMGGLGPVRGDTAKDERNRRKRTKITQTILKAIQKAGFYFSGSLHFCEVGFNAGYSASVALASDPSVRVTSIDAGEMVAVAVAHNYLDAEFPARLTLHLGFSRDVIPIVFRQDDKDRGGALCDVAFIDGGHEYESVLFAAAARRVAPGRKSARRRCERE